MDGWADCLQAVCMYGPVLRWRSETQRYSMQELGTLVSLEAIHKNYGKGTTRQVPTAATVPCLVLAKYCTVRSQASAQSGDIGPGNLWICSEKRRASKGPIAKSGKIDQGELQAGLGSVTMRVGSRSALADSGA